MSGTTTGSTTGTTGATSTSSASVGGAPVEVDETDRLIASNKVEGTAVYNRQGERLGTVHHFMVDKYTGQVAYAVMSFGGFLGIGEKQHPLPWSALTYDWDKEGYIVNLDKKMLENAPTLDPDDAFEWTPDYGRRIDKYYGAPTYW